MLENGTTKAEWNVENYVGHKDAFVRRRSQASSPDILGSLRPATIPFTSP